MNSTNCISSFEKQPSINPPPYPSSNPTTGRVMLPPASWYDQESTMKKVAVVALILAAIISATSIYALVTKTCIVALPVAGLIVSVALGILAAYYSSKNYWNDQKFVDRQATQVASMDYKQITKSYDWNTIKKHHLISKEEFQRKCFEAAVETACYPVIKTKFSKAIQYGYLTTNDIQNFLKNELDRLSFAQFIKQQSWLIFEDHIMEPGNVREKALSEIQAIETFDEIIQTYSWKILTHGIITSNDGEIQKKCFESAAITRRYPEIKSYFSVAIAYKLLTKSQIQEIIKSELNRLSFAQFIKEQSWLIFEDHIMEPLDVREKALSEIQTIKTFDTLIQTYSWEILRLGIITRNDKPVGELFDQILENNNFSQVSRIYPNAFDKKYSILPPKLESTMGQLRTRQIETHSKYEQSLDQNASVFQHTLDDAELQKEVTLKPYANSVETYERLIADEKQRHESTISNLEESQRLINQMDVSQESEGMNPIWIKIREMTLNNEAQVKERFRHEHALRKLELSLTKAKKEYQSILERAEKQYHNRRKDGKNQKKLADKAATDIYESEIQNLNQDFRSIYASYKNAKN